MQVESLHVYPVKSCHGLSMQEAMVGPRGFLFDRNWVVTDSGYEKYTQRELPKLATIYPEVRGDALVLSMDGLDDLQIPIVNKAQKSVAVDVWGNDCRGFDEGEDASEWLTNALSTPCRLVRFDESFHRQLDQEWIGDTSATAAFADVLPFLVVNTASLRVLNEWRMEAELEPCTIDRFRPNIVLSGLDPWAEDGLPAIQLGSVKIDLTRPCSRCGVPNIDQSVGEAEEFGNLQILSKKRLFKNSYGRPGAMFGVQGVCTSGVGNSIQVGGEVRTASLDPSLPSLPRLT